MNFETKLKENLNKDIDATNVDVIDAVMRVPFSETPKKRSFFSMPKRAVATLCASVLLLCVGVMSTDMLSSGIKEVAPASEPMATSMPSTYSARDYAITMESDVINVSTLLQQELLELDMSETVQVAVVSDYPKETLVQLVSLNRELTLQDFESYSATETSIIDMEISKSSIINMKDHFYFMLQSEK